jgi:hypothetical protein
MQGCALEEDCRIHCRRLQCRCLAAKQGQVCKEQLVSVPVEQGVSDLWDRDDGYLVTLRSWLACGVHRMDFSLCNRTHHLKLRFQRYLLRFWGYVLSHAAQSLKGRLYTMVVICETFRSIVS